MKTNEKKYDATTLIELLNEQKEVYSLRNEYTINCLKQGKTFSETLETSICKAYTAQLSDLTNKISSEAIYQEIFGSDNKEDASEFMKGLAKAFIESLKEEEEN